MPTPSLFVLDEMGYYVDSTVLYAVLPGCRLRNKRTLAQTHAVQARWDARRARRELTRQLGPVPISPSSHRKI